MCYCGLYVSKPDNKMKSIPERRQKTGRALIKPGIMMKQSTLLSFPIWRCDVCGYICARDSPPETCPICGASKDRFQLFVQK